MVKRGGGRERTWRKLRVRCLRGLGGSRLKSLRTFFLSSPLLSSLSRGKEGDSSARENGTDVNLTRRDVM